MSPADLPAADGPLTAFPAPVADGAHARDLGVYLHVPFCIRRCGYCDFNTYTNTELGGGADLADYAATAAREIAWAGRMLSAPHLRAAGLPARPVSTVFFGGGTPTMLPTEHLVAMLTAVRDTWGLAAHAEVTTEANPDSVDAADLRALADAGFTRVSFGMQSAVPHVLRTLDRTHAPERVPQAVRWAKDAGLDVSLDLIYGTPGESAEDWRRTLDAAVDMDPDHVSAYALVVEPGTRMGAQVRRGELPLPDDDVAAARYEVADATLGEAGYGWYEVSNWARVARDPERVPGHRRTVAGGGVTAHACRHNLAYWRGHDWWGVGPGAHGHLGGVRWWNVKHPRVYAQLLATGRGPAQDHEELDADTRELERVMLGVRLAEGLPLTDAQRGDETLRATLRSLVARGLVEESPLRESDVAGPRVVLTLRGRLLADAVVRELV